MAVIRPAFEAEGTVDSIRSRAERATEALAEVLGVEGLGEDAGERSSQGAALSFDRGGEFGNGDRRVAVGVVPDRKERLPGRRLDAGRGRGAIPWP